MSQTDHHSDAPRCPFWAARALHAAQRMSRQPDLGYTTRSAVVGTGGRAAQPVQLERPICRARTHHKTPRRTCGPAGGAYNFTNNDGKYCFLTDNALRCPRHLRPSNTGHAEVRAAQAIHLCCSGWYTPTSDIRLSPRSADAPPPRRPNVRKGPERQRLAQGQP